MVFSVNICCSLIAESLQGAHLSHIIEVIINTEALIIEKFNVGRDCHSEVCVPVFCKPL
jgi:hypothetical protein